MRILGEQHTDTRFPARRRNENGKEKQNEPKQQQDTFWESASGPVFQGLGSYIKGK